MMCKESHNEVSHISKGTSINKDKGNIAYVEYKLDM